MASLINGGEMRERLQELLKSATQNDGNGQKGKKAKVNLNNGKLSYAGSFERGD